MKSSLSSIKILGFLIILSCGFFSGIKTANATHAAGMEIFYRWTQDSTYEFTLIFYRNCLGSTASAPTSAGIAYKSASQSISSSFTVTQLPTSGTGIPSLSPPGMLNCYTGSFCFQEYVYRGTWTSPKRANDWIFSYELCCLPTNIAPANMQNGALYNECGLNNLDFPDGTTGKNISGIFHNRRPNHPGHLVDTIIKYPNISVCASRQQNIDQSVRNYDGDSTSYEFFIPQTTGGSLNTYISGYSFSSPIPSNGPFTIDTTSGLVQFVPGAPTGTGIYLIGIKATEYRNDTMVSGGSFYLVPKQIGFVKRNLFIVIQDSANCPDTISTFSDSVNTSSIISELNITCDNNPIEIGLSFEVKCSTIDGDASNLLLLNASTMDTVNIKYTTSHGCLASNVADNFRMHLDSALGVGNYYLMFVTGNDGNTIISECGTEVPPLLDTLTINVTTPAPLPYIVADTGLAAMDTVELECGENEFTIFTTGDVKCSSIIKSDFSMMKVSDSSMHTVNRARSTNCNPDYTTDIDIRVSAPLQPGYYILTLKTGNDDNTILDQCLRNLDSSFLIVHVKELEVDLGPDFTYCIEDSLWDTIISVPNVYDTYSWSTSSTQNQALIFTGGTYWIEVTNANGCVARDTLIVSGVNCYIGIENQADFIIKLYPNPTNTRVNVEIPTELFGSLLRIQSVDGKLVKEVTLAKGQNQIDLTQLGKGLYFVEIRSGDEQVLTEKLLIQ